MLEQQEQVDRFLRYKRAQGALKAMHRFVVNCPDYQAYLYVPYYTIPGDSSVAMAAMPMIGIVEEINPLVEVDLGTQVLHVFDANPSGFSYSDPEEFYPISNANCRSSYSLQFLDRAVDFLDNYFQFI